jgi:hypothetical protein
MTNIRKRRKSQDSRIKTLFAEIFTVSACGCSLHVIRYLLTPFKSEIPLLIVQK